MKTKFLFLCLIGLAGCATTTDRLRLISTKSTTGTPIQNGKKAQGESCRKSILFIPYEREGTLEDATDKALENSEGANALIDTKVRKKVLFTVLYNYRCIEIEGTPVKLEH